MMNVLPWYNRGGDFLCRFGIGRNKSCTAMDLLTRSVETTPCTPGCKVNDTECYDSWIGVTHLFGCFKGLSALDLDSIPINLTPQSTSYETDWSCHDNSYTRPNYGHMIAYLPPTGTYTTTHLFISCTLQRPLDIFYKQVLQLTNVIAMLVFRIRDSYLRLWMLHPSFGV